MSEVIFISSARLSFPHLSEPQRQVNAQTGKERVSYNCELLLPQDSPDFQKFMAQYGKLALEKWKDHAQAAMQLIQSDRKSRCFGMGNEKVNKKTYQPYEGYAGNVYITAGRDTPPQIIQADGTAIDPNNSMAYQQLTRKLYGGCYVNAAVKIWLQDNSHGRGVRCDLVAIQFAKDGDAFGEGTVDASSLFGAVAGNSNSVAAPAATGMGLPPFLAN